MKALIVYSSQTNNTRKVAQAIADVCPILYDLKRLDNDFSADIQEFDWILAGYWVENSKPDQKAVDFIGTLKNKKVVLFGTGGTSSEHPYVKSVMSKAEQLVDKSNQLLGHWICQGEINPEVIEQFSVLVNHQPENKTLAFLFQTFQEQFPLSLGHPNAEDIMRAKEYFTNLFHQSL